jgi:hypothetical protein
LVYFIQAVGTPFIKIGRSQQRSIKKRLAGMETGCPHNLQAKWLHKRFRKMRVRGEWFTVTEEEIDRAMAKASPLLSHYPSFLDYLFAQKERKDWIGDLARDVDDEEGSLSTFKEWRNHLSNHRACDNALRALAWAWREYRACQRTYEQIAAKF